MQFSCLILVFASIISFVSASNWATYPSVPKTASINGFADPIYTKLPSCAQDCVDIDTDNTPCPYWDTGCFCVMPQWAGEVAECFVSQCDGSDIASATSLALSLCSSAGANQWLIPASLSTALSSAVAEDVTSTSSGNEAQLTGSSNSTSNSLSNSSSSASGTSTTSTGNNAVMMASYNLPLVTFFMLIISLVL
mmetsp:Transcript_3861/g.3755  ORF Transcript_3861/g.3755 Transcript_3861/m.3755 type:complete len:194 (+) Transcript_3861:37-618(+)